MPRERAAIELGHARLRREDDHLRVDEHGDPESPEAMAAYFARIEDELRLAGLEAVLIVAQKTAPDPLAPRWPALREARWKALAASRAKRIAVLVDDELAVARVRMAAVAARAPVQAFVLETDAKHWLRVGK